MTHLDELKALLDKLEENVIVYDYGPHYVIDNVLEKIQELEKGS